MTDDDAYEPGDPKRADWADDLEERAEVRRGF